MTTHIKKSALLAAALTATSIPHIAVAQNAVDYRIIVRTMTNDSWTDGFGTDNWIYMTMHGESGSKKVELKGNHENGDTDAFTYSTKDIGVIKMITLDVSGDLSDKWGPLDVKILRGTKMDSTASADGWSKFYIGREIGYDPVSFTDPNPTPKAVTITEAGQPIDSSVTHIMVNYANNLTSPESTTGMQFTESWSEATSVGVSSTKTNTVGASAAISYEYGDEKTSGKFGVTAEASWEMALEEMQETVHEISSGSEFDWSFPVPRNTFLLRKVEFRIPQADQIFQDSLGQKFAVRKVTGKISFLPNAGSNQAIPERNLSDEIVPVSLSKLENEYFRHMKIADIQTIQRLHLDDWINRGWVTEDSEIPKGVTGKNALQVVYGGDSKHGNRFINTTGKNWLDQSYETGTKFTFVEINRDDWSIYLRDDDRDINVMLDLFEKKAKFSFGPTGTPTTSVFANIQTASR